MGASRHVVLLQPGTVSTQAVAQAIAFLRDGGTSVVMAAFERSDLADLKAGMFLILNGSLSHASHTVLSRAEQLE